MNPGTLVGMQAAGVKRKE